MADHNIYLYGLQSNTISKPDEDQYEIIAKDWIEFSEDHRRAAIYFSFVAVHMLFGMIFFALAYIAGNIIDRLGRYRLIFECLYVLFSIIALIFLFILAPTAIAHKYYFWRDKPDEFPAYLSICDQDRIIFFDKFSWFLADLFPSENFPFPPTLAPSHQTRNMCSPRVNEFINNNTDLRNYLLSLGQYKDIDRLFRIADREPNLCLYLELLIPWFSLVIPTVIIMIIKNKLERVLKCRDGC
ncbi:MAG: hypothetical protein H3Z54_06950 [archaeon]|nr:hypothetical protein [archaeon]